MFEIVLTEEIIGELINKGKSNIIVDGTINLISIDLKLESKIIDIIEEKWVKEYELELKK